MATRPAADGLYYDDLAPGLEFSVPTPVTVDGGLAAQYLAITGDALPLTLDGDLCEAVTGSPSRLVSPALVMHLSIGASTVATRKVLANLFYRNVVFRCPTFQDETLRTTTTVLGMADARPKEGARPRGKALLGITTTTDSEVVVDYERCPLLPCRSDAPPGHADNLGRASSEIELGQYDEDRFAAWDLGPLGAHDRWEIGTRRVDPLRDVVDQATALVRLSHNQAAVHRDVGLSPYGTRLVYGGHTISLAQASVGRMVGGLATVLGWVFCDHTGPVFEGDLLSCEHTVRAQQPWGSGARRAVQTIVWAHRADEEPAQVLDWTSIILTT